MQLIGAVLVPLSIMLPFASPFASPEETALIVESLGAFRDYSLLADVPPPLKPTQTLQTPLSDLLSALRYLQYRLVVTLVSLLHTTHASSPTVDRISSDYVVDAETEQLDAAEVSDAKRMYVLGVVCHIFSEIGFFFDRRIRSFEKYASADESGSSGSSGSKRKRRDEKIVLLNLLCNLPEFVRESLGKGLRGGTVFRDVAEILGITDSHSEILSHEIERIFLSSLGISYLSVCCSLVARGIRPRIRRFSKRSLVRGRILGNPGGGRDGASLVEFGKEKLGKVLVCPEMVLIEEEGEGESHQKIVLGGLFVSPEEAFVDEVEKLVLCDSLWDAMRKLWCKSEETKTETEDEGEETEAEAVEEAPTTTSPSHSSSESSDSPSSFAQSKTVDTRLSFPEVRGFMSVPVLGMRRSHLMMVQTRKEMRAKEKMRRLVQERERQQEELQALTSRIDELRHQWSRAVFPGSSIPPTEMLKKEFDALVDDFQAIVGGEASKWFARAFADRMKNRYPGNPDISRLGHKDFLTWPYGHNIPPIRGDEYINASLIQNAALSYICTQFPLRSTVVDFWDMIYRSEVEVIVALQQPARGIEQYWPDEGETLRIPRRFVLETTSMVPGRAFDTFEIHVHKCRRFVGKSAPRTVHLLLFKMWPDHGVPKIGGEFEFDDLKSLFVECRALQRDSRRPLCVHCTAGIGRTGVFVLAHNLLASGRGLGQLRTTLFKFRTGRYGLVGYRFEQYEYLHHFVRYCQS